MYSRIKVLFRQFNVLTALKLFLADAIRKIFDPANINSYSQTGEDRVLGYELPSTGFYVDVGCNHPQARSNTFALYRKGWIGVNIDANKDLVHRHQKLKPRDISICAAVSNKSQEIVFTEFEDSLVSSLSSEHVDEWQQKRTIKRQRVVQTVLLSDILERCEVPKTFDLLCIDVEGHDFEVLRSIDLDIYRPKQIVVEMHKFDFLEPGSNEIYKYLESHQYKLTSYAIMNGYFTDMLLV